MSESNKWIPVSERLPDKAKRVLARISTGELSVAYIGACSYEWTVPGLGPVDDSSEVTHWMDLPEPPELEDPFEAWYGTQPKNPRWPSPECDLMRNAWDAAKEHYAKPLPDFETWWDSLTKSTTSTLIGNVAARWVNKSVAQAIWNAAQGK